MIRSLDVLTQLPEAERDDAWEQEFLKQIVSSKVELTQDQAQQGPDGWPYMVVRTGTPNATEPFDQIVRWCASRGVGIAVNTHKMMPDYVFTYGMIWGFVESALFVHPTPPPRAGEVTLGSGDQVILGEPSEKYLPRYVRQILREFLAAQDFKTPKVLAMSSLDYKSVDLVFSIESLDNLDVSHHRTLAEAIGWFLPLHYSLIFGSEQNLRGFVDL